MKLCLLLLLAGWLLMAGTSVLGAEAAGGADTAAVVKGNNEFALDLYARLRGREGNLFFSPSSLSTALAMTYTGARGRTAEQMASTLHLPTDQKQMPAAFAALVKELNGAGEKRAYQLSVANALWGQKGHPFLPDFLKELQDSFGAGLREADFATSPEEARQAINAWVEKETRDKIKDLVPPGALTPDTRMVLANAIYFKGTWEHQFMMNATREGPFQLGEGKTVRVPLMSQKKPFHYLDGGSFQALEMAYKGQDLSMVVLLPKKVDGLADLEKSLTADRLAGWLSKMSFEEVSVVLPRFKMTSKFGLADVLAQMGMPLAFQPQAADFSGMDGKQDLFISAVLHKAFVDVNEEGTEAAAATGIAVGTLAMRVTPVFRADHPFVFLIRDRHSGSILFLGRVTDSSK